MTEQILDIASEVQDYINKSYDYFANRFLNIDTEHRFDIKQECVAKSAFWVTKKRYGQWIINDGGLECEKLDVKGLDIVRSSFPPAFRDFMTKVLKAILAKVPKEKIDEFMEKLAKEQEELHRLNTTNNKEMWLNDLEEISIMIKAEYEKDKIKPKAKKLVKKAKK